MAVDNLEEFHKENLLENKEHYTMFVRFTQGKILNIVQQRGAKIHFNEIEMPQEYVDDNSKVVSIFFTPIDINLTNSIFDMASSA